MGNSNTCPSNEDWEVINSSDIPQQNDINIDLNNPTIFADYRIRKYIEEKKELYNSLMMYLESSENSKQDFQDLIDKFNNQKEEKAKAKLEQIIQLITEIANNHHRNELFFTKIFQIIHHLKEEIKQTFSNIEIFKLFQENKKILLFLFKSKIIAIDDAISKEIIYKNEANGNRYCHFFYPEIKEFISKQELEEIKNELLLIDNEIFDRFDEKREEGENESYICSLIRKDSVEEFISYVNKFVYPLNSKIKSSIFETNSFLIENSPTLIEYSAFFGSIQIFQYLQMTTSN